MCTSASSTIPPSAPRSVSLIKAGEWAQGALSQVMIEHIRHFERMEHSYLKERAVDVKDLGTRVLAYLQAARQGGAGLPEQTILVGEELTASALGEIPREKLAGLISVKGSGNSHVAILARAMGVPTVMGAVDLPYTRLQDREVIIDGYNGTVHLNPRAGNQAALPGDADRGPGPEPGPGIPARRALRNPRRPALPLWVNTGFDGRCHPFAGAGRRRRGPVPHRDTLPAAGPLPQ